MFNVHLLDVGHQKYGECLLIEAADKTILIDAGHKGDEEILKEQFAQLLGVPAPVHVDLIHISHAHADHIGVMPSLVASGDLTAGAAFIPHPNFAWPESHIDLGGVLPDAPNKEAFDMVWAMLREQPLDLEEYDDATLREIMADGVKDSERYDQMIERLETDGTEVIKWPDDDAQARLTALLAPAELTIIGPQSIESRALVAKLQASLGSSTIDESKRRHLIRADEVLVDAGVGRDEEDALLSRSLELGQEISSQPWKGLVRIFELVINAKLDPTSPAFARELESAATDGIYCAHRRGAEYVVNDWQVARALLDLDSRYVDAEGNKHRGRGERPRDAVIRTSQAAGSVLPGIVAPNADLAALGAAYHPALQIHLTAMVTKDGEDHRAHKSTFDPFFSRSAISNLSAFIGTTMDQVLDEVAADAEANDGAFDFREDFAFNFPIRVTCEILGLPPEDTEMVRDLTQAAMRSLDIGGGMSQQTLVEGGRATLEFQAYLEQHLLRSKGDSASGDREVKGVIGELGDRMRRLEDGSLAGSDKEISGTLLERIANAGTEDDRQSAFDAIIADLGILVFAGFETTMSSVSMGTFELLKRYGQWVYLRDKLIQDPEVVLEGLVVPDTDLRWHDALSKRQIEGTPEVVEARLSQTEIERSRALTELLRGSEALRGRLQQVRAQEQMLKNAVEEMMRWTSPGSVIPLITHADLSFPSPCDTTMEGRIVKEGEMIRFPKGSGIMVDLRATNRGRPNGRDLGAGGCPFSEGLHAQELGDFDVSREAQIPAKGHLSFGAGAHVCLGANLAVENSKRMLEAILRRCPDLEINGVPEETDTTLFMGFKSFPVRSRSLSQS